MIIFTILFLIIIAPYLMRVGYDVLVKTKNNKEALLLRHKNKPQLVEPLLEGSMLTTQYKDYVVWRRKQHESDLINISDDYSRKSSNEFRAHDDGGILFLGGSTMFGGGVKDEHTIPSFFSDITGTKVKNFGETGYIARQSLSFYQNLLIEGKFKDKNMYIISYDGANDVGHRCRSEINYLETGYQNLIERKIQDKSKNFLSILDPWLDIIQKYKDATGATPQQFNCDTDIKKALHVAQTLINTWKNMDILAKSHKHKFIAILQPLAFYRTPELNYTHDKDDIVGRQIRAVYPIILNLVKKENFEFIDMTKVLDGKYGNSYYDFCHLDANGNKKIAEELAKVLY